LKPKVSVIIPVYNVEPYLRHCLDSVISQTLKEIEIICVDDGSTDNSGKILDEYALHDKRFKIIHKSNGGLVSARKVGINFANAIYVAYVDSDDWVEPEMLENMYSSAVKDDSDVLICRGIFREYSENMIISKSTIPAGIYKGNTLITEIHAKMLRSNNASSGIPGSLCAKLFKRFLVERYQNLVDDRIIAYEDGSCSYPCIAHAKIVTIIEDTYYHYRKNNVSSITHNKNEDYLLNLHLVYNTLKAGFLTADDSELLLCELTNFMGPAIYRSSQYLFGSKGHCCSYGFVFPFQTINKGCRLLLYGAGGVGIVYYRQLIATGYCSDLLWVDRDWRTISAGGFPVKPLEEISKYDFDAAVIAIFNEGRANAIRSYLLEQNVSKEKIIWKDPTLDAI
jgi:Glycosyltransferases involved in cell wall biogenesis